jgi:hypothetical protein
VQSFLALAGRLGRASDSEAGLNLSVSTKVDPLPSGRHALVVGSPQQVQSANGAGLPVSMNPDGSWHLNLWRWGEAIVRQFGGGVPLLEQGTIGGNTVAWLSAADDAAFNKLTTLLESDEAFAGLDDGAAIQAVSTPAGGAQPFAFQTVVAQYEGRTQAPVASTNSGSGWFDWLLKPLGAFFGGLLGGLFSWIGSWPIWGPLMAPFHWVGNALTSLITAFLALPLINVAVPAIFGFLSPVLHWGPIGAVTQWLAGHPILNFLVGLWFLLWLVQLVSGLLSRLIGRQHQD